MCVGGGGGCRGGGGGVVVLGGPCSPWPTHGGPEAGLLPVCRSVCVGPSGGGRPPSLPPPGLHV